MTALVVALLLAGCTDAPAGFELDATIASSPTDAVAGGEVESTFNFLDLAAAKATPPTIELIDGAGLHVLAVPYQCDEYDAIQATTRLRVVRDAAGVPGFEMGTTTCTSANGVTLVMTNET